MAMLADNSPRNQREEAPGDQTGLELLSLNPDLDWPQRPGLLETPERNLLAAVINRAIDDWLGYMAISRGSRSWRRNRRRAFEWLMSDPVCTVYLEALDIDPDWFRRQLGRLEPQVEKRAEHHAERYETHRRAQDAAHRTVG